MNRFAYAFGAALSLSAAFGSFAACKSNVITSNTDDYESYVTQNADPASDTTIDGPDHSRAHIPAGAVGTTTAITIAKMKTGTYPDFPAGWAPAGGVYSFEPHAQSFAKLVDLRVPYAEPGKPVRLAVSEPGGGWSAVDGAALAGGFATTQSPHFSFYAVVTGAPPDPTLVDAGADAPTDATMDATVDSTPEAAPPPPPTIFATSGGSLHRIFLSPLVIVDAGQEAGASDGGSFPLPNGKTLAYGAPPSLLFAAQTQPGVDGGAPTGSVTPFADPFGAMVQDGAAPLNVPGTMAVINGELWVANTSTGKLETYDATGTRTWVGATLRVDGMAFDAATGKLYVVQAIGSKLLVFDVAGTGASKTVTPVVGDAGSITLGFPGASAIALTPWNELLVVGGTAHHLDLAGNDLGTYTAVTLMLSGGVGAIRWPGGLDEILVSDFETGSVGRYYFAPSDTTHTTAIYAASIPIGGIPGGVVIAP